MMSRREIVESETQSAVANPTGTKLQAGVASRIAIVAVLGLTLLGAVHWAMTVSNANTQQVSQNLAQMQGRFDAQAALQAKRHK